MQAQGTNPSFIARTQVALASGQSGSAYSKAQGILRQEAPLTLDEFEELGELFRKMTRAQFGALIDDPFHQRQLRSYEVLSWRRGLPLQLIVLFFLLLGIAGGMVVITTS